MQTGKEQNGIHLIDQAAQDLINMKFMEGPRCQRDINGLLSGQRHEQRFCSFATSVTDSLPILWTITKRNVLWQQPTSGLMPTKRKENKLLSAIAMAATAVVLQHLHLHYITVATYHHYSLFHHPKGGQPPTYRKQQTGNTDPHYPAARPEPPPTNN